MARRLHWGGGAGSAATGRTERPDTPPHQSPARLPRHLQSTPREPQRGCSRRPRGGLGSVGWASLLSTSM